MYSIVCALMLSILRNGFRIYAYWKTIISPCVYGTLLVKPHTSVRISIAGEVGWVDDYCGYTYGCTEYIYRLYIYILAGISAACTALEPIYVWRMSDASTEHKCRYA